MSDRAIISRRGKAIPLSTDHKPALTSELNRIEKAGGWVTAQGRINGNLNLSRALGDLKYKGDSSLGRHEQIITLEAEVADMVERFETRKLVDRAKGLLNEKMGLSEPEAFRWIQKASMDRRLTMQDVAKAIIEQLAPKKA